MNDVSGYDSPAGTGCLFVVATPIGNLEDLTARAARILGTVDLILAEDTRRTARLLAHLGLDTPMRPFHDHNERGHVAAVAERLRAGQSIALVSDAGTPLLSDPGYPLVRGLRESGLRVEAVPGPSALTAALSVAGLPTDRFAFEGFLPAKKGARRRRLAALAAEPRTVAFYEAPHRVAEWLADAAEVIGADREAVVARELTKRFESVVKGSLAELSERYAAGSGELRGEFVILLAGAPESAGWSDDEADALLLALLAELPPGRAAAVAAKYLGAGRKALYQRALALSRTDDDGETDPALMAADGSDGANGAD